MLAQEPNEVGLARKRRGNLASERLRLRRREGCGICPDDEEVRL